MRHILGDPHLGKAFVNNVPLSRRGDRERMVWAQFEASLDTIQNGDTHVMMGDLFDKAQPGYGVVMRAAMTYIAAARRAPAATFIVIRGNHDASRDFETVSGFDVFAAITSRETNIRFASDEPLIIGESLYVGWHPTKAAADIIRDLPPLKGVSQAFGHWDVDPRSAEHNLVPTAALAALGIREAWSGHVHKPGIVDRDGVTARLVGSMAPYAHGEEAVPDMYLTLTQAEAKARDDLHDKCIRISLEPGEIYDAGLDCLHLSFIQASAGTSVDLKVTADEFDLSSLFADCMAGVPAGVLAQVEARWREAL